MRLRPARPVSFRLGLILAALASAVTTSVGLAGTSHGGLTSLGNLEIPAPANEFSSFGKAVATGDFDGDGRLDLAVGLPSQGNHSGFVEVFLFPAGQPPQWARYHAGPLGSETGWSLAAGDFDGDGKDELAVGRPSEVVGNADAGGRVVILGWSAPGNVQLVQLTSFTQGMPLIGETPEDFDYFGRVLATGDFNNDGYDDLAVGVPFEDLPGGVNQGIVHVIYGFANGLTAAGSQIWSQESNLVLGEAQDQDAFGRALAAGDFDGDQRDDLAIGISGEPGPAAQTQAGGVAVLYGAGATGLAAGGNQLWQEGSGGLPGTAQGVDYFGFALAAGRFNADGRDDLAIGAPSDDAAGTNAGAVFVLLGSAARLTGAGSQRWTNAQLDLLGSSNLGESLASGDFDGDGQDDLAIGSPFADVGNDADAGALDMLRGGAAGLTAIGAQHWTADRLASGPSRPGDLFTFAMATGDLDGDHCEDLFIGLPGRKINGLFVGTVQLLRGLDRVFADDFEAGGVGGWSTGQP